MTHERRQGDGRDTCQIEGRAIFEDVEVPCVVEDISTGGAKLRVEMDVIGLPETFKLALPIAEHIVQEQVVELRWRVAEAVGVKFAKDGAADSES